MPMRVYARVSLCDSSGSKLRLGMNNRMYNAMEDIKEKYRRTQRTKHEYSTRSSCEERTPREADRKT